MLHVRIRRTSNADLSSLCNKRRARLAVHVAEIRKQTTLALTQFVLRTPVLV
jgi:hypothetical protein